ncbi:uncharacterized protein LOC104857837 [Fukomys damarensis]|uniref:uncharacterized protein LOC104857837 n=1 Tax=Fukomys damarensis TaxID=885580 RepID=UPI00053F82E1|nr:uncharacterized protein LOC104857837 [Fukomys damarensis]
MLSVPLGVDVAIPSIRTEPRADASWLGQCARVPGGTARRRLFWHRASQTPQKHGQFPFKLIALDFCQVDKLNPVIFKYSNARKICKGKGPVALGTQSHRVRCLAVLSARLWESLSWQCEKGKREAHRPLKCPSLQPRRAAPDEVPDDTKQRMKIRFILGVKDATGKRHSSLTEHGEQIFMMKRGHQHLVSIYLKCILVEL